MAPSSPAADVASFYIRELGALLAGVAFLFLWRRSRVAYFGLLAAAFAMRIVAGIFVFEWWSPSHPAWLSLYAAFELAVLAAIVAAMAMWRGCQAGPSREPDAQMDRLRREAARNLDLDRLTGLLNQAALARRLEEPPSFQGVVAVCDMDGFKDINDSYGHLVGDEKIGRAHV